MDFWHYIPDKITGNFARPFTLNRQRELQMRDIRSNNLRFLIAIIVACCLLVTPVLQAVTLHNQTEMMEKESGCCCYPDEKEDAICLIREIVRDDDCPCKFELSEPTFPAPFRADIQSKFELNQNSDICVSSIANRLSDEPTLVLSDFIANSIHSPPLYISNSAFII